LQRPGGCCLSRPACHAFGDRIEVGDVACNVGADDGIPDYVLLRVLARPEGSATGKRYVHRRPEYLRTVVDGVEALYAALQPFVSRVFAGPELDEQPMPDSIDLSGLNVSARRASHC